MDDPVCRKTLRISNFVDVGEVHFRPAEPHNLDFPGTTRGTPSPYKGKKRRRTGRIETESEQEILVFSNSSFYFPLARQFGERPQVWCCSGQKL